MERIQKLAVVVMVIVALVCLIGAWSKWRDCDAAGGITVRGIFGLECIK